MIDRATPADTNALVELAVSTGLFAPADADLLLRDVLDALYEGRLGDGHHAHVWRAEPAGPPGGWVYFAAQAKADGVWDLWWIGVALHLQGQGVGDTLLRFVEEYAKAAGGRILLIETSALPPLERTRRFYVNRGYGACGVVPDYYGDGDGKVTFVKRLPAIAR